MADFKWNPFTQNLDMVGTASGGSGIATLTGNTGGAIGPDGSGNVNIVGSGGITVAGSGNTLTITSTSQSGTPFAIWNTNSGGTASWMTSPVITGSYITTGGNLSLPFTNNTLTAGVIVYNTTTNVMTCDAVNNFLCGPGVNSSGFSGSSNIAFAQAPLGSLTSGTNNTGLGHTPFSNLTTGSQNVGIGGYVSSNAGVGINYTSSESDNILLNHPGVTGESNVMRLGLQGTGVWEVNKCFIAGIVGVTTSNSEMVTIDSTTGQLGVASIPGGTVTSVSGTTNRITSTGGTTPVIDISASYVGQSSITTLGTIGTGTWQGTVVGPTYGGTGVNNGALTITLASGGTGKVLTSDSSGNATWQAAAAGGITTLAGNSGSATGSTVTISASGSSSVAFTGSSSTLSLTFLDGSSNLCLGGTAAGAANVFLGDSFNVSGAPTSNVGIGQQFFRNLGASAAANVAIGINALGQLGGGSFNTAIGGNDPGYNYTGNESYNIAFMNLGVTSESNTLRIGTGTGSSAFNLNQAFIAGIQGIVVTGSPVLVSSSDQLGVAVSSQRFKSAIQDMATDSSSILKLRPVTFQWNKDSAPGLKDATDERQYGLIAEEVEKVFPYLVAKDNDGKALLVKYHELPAILLNELQKALARIEALEKKVA